MRKRSICLLLVLSILAGIASGCKTDEIIEPTLPKNEEEATGPFRPDDPGVIAPLADKNQISEDGVVWDMENLPDDLVEEKWATPNWASEDAFVMGNVQFLGVDGKGYEGSRAFAIRQVGAYSWSDVYTIGLKRDETAFTNWSSGELLWIWYDSRELPMNMTLELELNGEHMQTGATYYYMDESAELAQKAGSTPEAYTGAGYGRIPLKGNAVGWVGVPLSAFGEGYHRVNSFYIHLSYSAEAPTGSALYLDSLCVTPADQGPMGAALSDVSAKLATSDKPAWDMENLPADLVARYWASMDGAGYEGYRAGNIRVLGAAGSGVGRSRALRVSQAGQYHYADVFSVNLSTDETAYTDWSQGELLWFWVDTSALRDDLQLDLFLDGRRPKIGAAYYGINSALSKQSAGTLKEAYAGAGYGRITIGAGYRGWVGLPLSAFGTVTDVINVTMHLAYSGDNSAGKSVYFDEFWVTGAEELPKTASGASISVLRGGNSGVDPNLGPALDLPCEVWSMENIPLNPVASDVVFATYPTHADFRAGNVTFSRAEGKGYLSSNALQLKQVGEYSWSDCYQLDFSKDSSAKRNWSGGTMLWFWLDASEHTVPIGVDWMIDGKRPVVDAQYYTIPAGEGSATAQTLGEAYSDAGYGRFHFAAGFVGWVGVPLEAFSGGVSGVSLMELHVSYRGETYRGRSLYFDAFWITAQAVSPEGHPVTPVQQTDIPYRADMPVWDMEQTPTDLLLSAWATASYADVAEYQHGNVSLLGAAEKGRGGSRAMELRFQGAYNWADVFALNLRADSKAATDWTGGELLWFWVDAAALTADAEIELVLNGVKADASVGYYQPVDGAPVRQGELIVAWDLSGRIPLQAGYVGWLGIPLRAFGTVEKVSTLSVHIAGNGVLPGKRLYLDELWVTALDQTPVGAENGYIYQESGGEVTLPLEVWSMENLPADLMAAQWAAAKYPNHADYHGENVLLQGAAGKGHKTSMALAFLQKGEYNWSDVFQLSLSRDDTAITRWAGADMLWIWVDASAFDTTIHMELNVDGRFLTIGEPYYTVSGTMAKQAGTLPRAYEGANFGRLPIAAEYVGWIGIPFSAYSRTPTSAELLELHVSYASSEHVAGKTLYLDAFTLTDSKTGPDGITIEQQTSQDILATSDKAAWDMENLPEDLLAASWVSMPWAAHADFVAGNINLRGVDGKGRNGTRALAIAQNGAYCWADEAVIELSNDTCFANDWRNGDMLMLWVDATEFAGETLALELLINGTKPAADTSYFVESNGMLVKAGTLPDAWGGSAGYGRLPLADGFKGWIAVPLSAYGSVKTVRTIQLHVAYSKNQNIVGNTLYLDDFWVISGNQMPSDSVSGNGGAESDITDILNDAVPVTPDSFLQTDPATTYQTIRAYGISDAWWTNALGTNAKVNDIMRLFYTDDGIALSNYRINIGGSVLDDRSDGPTYEPSWRAVYSPLGEDGTIDISRNKGSWSALQALRSLISSGEASVNDFTLFINSPPSSMTDNGLTYNNNRLKPECYDDFAAYVAEVVALYELNGIAVRYVSPINEPTLAAWTGNAGQESCVYTVEEIITVYEKIIDALEARGLDTKLSIAEFSSWNDALASFDRIMASEKIASHIDHYTAHDYSGSVSTKRAMQQKAAAAGLSVHMSEWCMAVADKADTMDTALQLAQMLYTDLTILNVDTWSWWIGVGRGGYSDALIYAGENDAIYEVTKRFWAYGNYSKFTRGYTRVEVDESALPDGVYASAYTYTDASGKSTLVYVVGNESATAQTITFAGLPADARGNLYETSAANNCKQIGYLTADCGYILPAESVTTVIFQDIDLNAVDKDAEPEGEVERSKSLADMETLAEDLFAAGGASSYFPANVGAVRADGKGFNASTALGYVYKNYDGGNYWGNSIELTAGALGMTTEWKGGELLWFWVDASEFTGALGLDLWINDVKPAVGATLYTWDGSGTPLAAGALPDAWNGGAGFGRLPLPQGYKGFVGIPLSAYGGLDLNAIQKVYFYIQPVNDKDALPKTLYLDEFWVTAADNVPKVTVKAVAQPEAPALLVVELPAEDAALPTEQKLEVVEEPAAEEPQEPEAPLAPDEAAQSVSEETLAPETSAEATEEDV